MEIGKILLLTYIIIASNYCKNLFSNSLKNAIENNRYVQHLILIILIMSLLIIFEQGNSIKFTSNKHINVLIMTLIIYTWFILTTKLDLAWNIAIMIILIIYFFYENNKNNDYKNINNDKNLSNKDKNELHNVLINTQKSLLLGIFGITLTGTFIYGIEKYNQYGPKKLDGGYNYLQEGGGYNYLQEGGGYNYLQEGGGNSFNMLKFFFN
jgi:chromate transport protein ChrA